MNSTQEQVLETISRLQPVWKYRIAVELNLPQSTVRNAIDRLLIHGYIEVTEGAGERSGGKERAYYRVKRSTKSNKNGERLCT